MSTSFDPWGLPPQQGDPWGLPPRQGREPLDPLLSLPDHPSGEWAATPQRQVGHPRPARDAYAAASGLPYDMMSDPEPLPFAGRPARRLRRGLTLVLVVLLIGVSGWEAWRLEQVDRRLDSTSTRQAATLHAQNDRVTKELSEVFDPQSVSSNVLPSVFRVRAGNFTGTAFSIGDKAPDGQSNLLTNFHVVQSVFDKGVRKVFLERGQTELGATIVKIDRRKDLALLRASKKIAGLPVAAATVKPGQPVVVAGAPLGLDDTVTSGVISAWRPDDQDGAVIQTDAPINPGNSGGPVVNAHDEVVGVATAKARDAEGIGLAVPIKTACDTFNDIC
jgi:putative serine protease PepD